MSDDYQKFGSNPPIQPYPNDPNLPANNPYNQQYYPPYQQQYYPPDHIQQNPQQYQIPPNPQNYQNPPNYQNQPYNQNYQNNNFVVVQPIYAANQNPPQPQNQYPPNFHSALVCLLTLLAFTIMYQVWMVIFFGVNAHTIEFPVNVVWGLIFAVCDCLDLIVCFFFFQSSKVNKTYCKKGMTLFGLSLIFFILTYSITFSQTYYETEYENYYYYVPVIWLVIQVILRIADLVAMSSYSQKRNLVAWFIG